MFGVPLHKLIIHFPIALMIIAAIYDSWAVYSKRTQLHAIGYSARAREQYEYRIGWLILEVGAAVLVATTAVMGHQL